MSSLNDDDRRHKREEEERKKKRHESRTNKSVSRQEKERRRKERNAKILQEANRKRAGHHSSSTPPPPPGPPPPSSSSKSKDDGGSSKFQALFHERAEGFVIDLNFRNAPPRPPVGPCFVGLGLDGELADKWTAYRPKNAIDTNHSWRLHAEEDLGVPLAPSAMDWEGCYTDPNKAVKKQKVSDDIDDDDMDLEEEEEEKTKPKGPPPLHPDDDAILNWKGAYGDTAAKELQMRKDKARAAARLRSMNTGNKSTSTKTTSTSNNPTEQHSQNLNSIKLSRDKNPLKSRVLDEANPYFMKKTTYLANDQSKSVHAFKSLARTKAEAAVDIQRKMEVHTKSLSDKDGIERSFDAVSRTAATNIKRKHPSKKNVEAVYEIPLFPDVESWGHTFTHVVMDNLPKNAGTRKKFTTGQMQDGFIVDVKKSDQNKRMECNLIVPSSSDSSSSSKPLYEVASVFDLDVMPLKEEDAPHTNFVLKIDEEKKVATYHPISSRVQLSAGRQPGNFRTESGGGNSISNNNSGGSRSRYVSRMEWEKEDEEEMEVRMAEIDVDYAKKHGIETGLSNTTTNAGKTNDDDDDGSGDDGRGKDLISNSVPKQDRNSFLSGDTSDSDDEF